MDELDAALALLVKIPDLYPCLEKKQQAALSQIFGKRIIVDPDEEIIDYELNSPFVSLRLLVEEQNNHMYGSEQLREEALFLLNPPRFLKTSEVFVSCIPAVLSGA